MSRKFAVQCGLKLRSGASVPLYRFAWRAEKSTSIVMDRSPEAFLVLVFAVESQMRAKDVDTRKVLEANVEGLVDNVRLTLRHERFPVNKPCLPLQSDPAI
jgi:hypothetical protein